MKILPITVVSVSDLDAEYPFTYLCRVLNKPRTDQPSYHTVKVMPPDYQILRLGFNKSSTLISSPINSECKGEQWAAYPGIEFDPQPCN